MVTQKPKDLESVSEEALSKVEKSWVQRMIKRIEHYIHASVDDHGKRYDHRVYVRLNSFYLPRASPFAIAVLAKRYRDAGWTVETGYCSDSSSHLGDQYIRLS